MKLLTNVNSTRLLDTCLIMMAFKTPGDIRTNTDVGLTTESVQGASLSLQGVHNVKSGDGLASGVLSVSDSVLNN